MLSKCGRNMGRRFLSSVVCFYRHAENYNVSKARESQMISKLFVKYGYMSTYPEGKFGRRERELPLIRGEVVSFRKG